MEVVTELRHIHKLWLVRVGHGLHFRGHIRVGHTEPNLDIVIPLGQAAFFFHDQRRGLQRVPMGVPVLPHLLDGILFPAHAPEDLFLGEGFPIHHHASRLDLA